MSHNADKPPPGRPSGFGRRPGAERPKLEVVGPDAGRRKRSAAVVLVALGAGALGLMTWARSSNCQPSDPNQPSTNCSSRSSGSGGSWTSSSSTQHASNSVQRGGFGSTGAAHFSGGGG